MSRSILVSVLAPCALVAVVAAPLLAAPADTVRTRISGFRELGAAFKAVNDGLRGSNVQTIMIQQSAREIRSASRNIYSWFPAGTGPGPGLKTKAKAEIWSKPAQFRAVQDAFAKQAELFQRVAASGNAAAMRTEARKLGATCKSCHDAFRVPSD